MDVKNRMINDEEFVNLAQAFANRMYNKRSTPENVVSSIEYYQELLARLDAYHAYQERSRVDAQVAYTLSYGSDEFVPDTHDDDGEPSVPDPQNVDGDEAIHRHVDEHLDESSRNY